MGNYPLGAENDPNAPYNEKGQNYGKELVLDCEVEVVMRKKIKIRTTNTIYDEEYGWYVNEDENFVELYKQKEFTLTELMNELKNLAKEKLAKKLNIREGEAVHLVNIINSCDGWETLDIKCE